METIRNFLRKHEPWLMVLGFIAVLYMYQERPFQAVAAAEGTGATEATGPTISYDLGMAFQAHKKQQGQPNTYDSLTSHPLPPRSFSSCIGMRYDRNIGITSSGPAHKKQIMQQCCNQARGQYKATNYNDGGRCSLSSGS